ncbi:MAG: Trm112 family protein [Smithellaceae bacterium]
MAWDEKILEILACPQCHGSVRREEKSGGLMCDSCKLLYEVRNDIPVMLVVEAKKIS